MALLNTLAYLAYLIAAILFILGLKRLSSPATARGGNQLASLGMLIAVLATLVLRGLASPTLIIAGLAVGGGIGMFLARWVKMTAMPEMVAAFNGFGGGASVLVASAEIAKYIGGDGNATDVTVVLIITIFLSLLIGMVTFSGSFVALGKLSGKISGNPVSFPGMRLLTVLVTLGAIAAGVWMSMGVETFATDLEPFIWGTVAVVGLAFLLGILVVIPIGGADMPVVVALLNSYSGLAASATGFVLQNNALIISGALVGASGLILTKIMCDAMNRSLTNVLLGGFGGDAAEGTGPVAQIGDQTIRETGPEDAAILVSYADKVTIVPGYGMAVAQAQHQVRELADLLQSKDVEVKYAIHPVAGRMPGHMNVLLAEANVPYDQLFDMDDINPDFETTDVVLVIGANDVVNPAARHDTASPIYGMPILDVDKAKNIIVFKRSMRPGYAGVGNELFHNSRTAMFFGDAKDSVGNLISEVKAL